MAHGNTHVRLVNIDVILTVLATFVALAFIMISDFGATLVVVFCLNLARNRNRFGIRAVFLRRFIRNGRFARIHQVYRRGIRVNRLVDELEHFGAVAAAEFNHASTAKVVRILAVTLQALGRGQTELLEFVLKLSDTTILATAAVVAFLEQFTRHKRDFIFVQSKFIDNNLVGLVNVVTPVVVSTVTLALMEKDTLDYANFLSLFAKFQNSSHRVSTVIICPALKTATIAIEISLVLVREISSNAHTTDSHRNHPHGHARQGIDHRTAKVVRRGEIFKRMEHRRNRRGPFAHLDGLRGLAASLACICRVRRQHYEVLGSLGLVLGRHDIAVTRHVRLPVSNVNMEIGVRSRNSPRNRKQRKTRRSACDRHKIFKNSHAHRVIPSSKISPI